MITFDLGELDQAIAGVALAVPAALDRERLAALPVTSVTAFRDGAPAGFLILGTVNDGFGRDLAVYAAQASGGGMTEAMDGYLRAVALAAGLEGVRCHTGRAGLVRKLERLGWVEASRMMRVAVR